VFAKLEAMVHPRERFGCRDACRLSRWTSKGGEIRTLTNDTEG